MGTLLLPTGRGVRWPLAATLSLGDDSYSDFLRELSEYVGVRLPYNVSV